MSKAEELKAFVRNYLCFKVKWWFSPVSFTINNWPLTLLLQYDQKSDVKLYTKFQAKIYMEGKVIFCIFAKFNKQVLNEYFSKLSVLFKRIVFLCHFHMMEDKRKQYRVISNIFKK